MPYSKIKAIHFNKGLSQCIKYITNPEKTNGGILVDGFNIGFPQFGDQEMLLTQDLARQVSGNAQSNQDITGYHIIQSFHADEKLTPEKVHAIGMETARKYLGDAYEFVIATHVDGDHIHNHIVFNSVSHVNLKKFHQHNMHKYFQEVSDKISSEHGAKIFPGRIRADETEETQEDLYNYDLRRDKQNFREQIRVRLDFLMNYCTNLEDFKEKLIALDIQTDFSKKYVTYLLPTMGQVKGIRDRSLSKRPIKEKEEDVYLLSRLLERFSRNKQSIPNSLIVEEFEKYKEIFNSPDAKIKLNASQISSQTDQFVYIPIRYGKNKSGLAKISKDKIRFQDGQPKELQIKFSDWFSIINLEDRETLAMKGSVLLKQLEKRTSYPEIRFRSSMNELKFLQESYRFLSQMKSFSVQSLEDLSKKLEDKIAEIKTEIKVSEMNLGQFIEREKLNPRPDTPLAIKRRQEEIKALKDQFISVQEKYRHAQKLESFSRTLKRDRESFRPFVETEQHSKEPK